MVNRSILGQIRSKSIVAYVSSVVDLKKKGINYECCCPLHNEKTPSFKVTDVKNIYKCFGCGEGGDVIDFYMHYNKVSFPVAVKALCAFYNIEYVNTKYEDKKDVKYYQKLSITQCNTAIMEFYQSDMIENSRFFTKKGIDNETVERFNIGYAKPQVGLKSRLLALGYESDVIKKAGALNSVGGAFFQNRIIFPIKDYFGKVVGFGGRAIKDGPKYINSPQTAVYDKSRVLYGLYEAKRFISTLKCAILVEGYTDVMAMHQFGFGNAVATCGTALTGGHLKEIGRLTKSIVLLRDGDKAGRKAVLRDIDKCVGKGVVLNVVELPNGMDPNDFLVEHGKEKMKSLLDGAVNWLDYLLIGFNQHKIEKQKEMMDYCRSMIKKIHDPVLRELHVTKLAQISGQVITLDADSDSIHRTAIDDVYNYEEDMYALIGSIVNAKPEDVYDLMWHIDEISTYKISCYWKTVLENIVKAICIEGDLGTVNKRVRDYVEGGDLDKDRLTDEGLKGFKYVYAKLSLYQLRALKEELKLKVSDSVNIDYIKRMVAVNDKINQHYQDFEKMVQLYGKLE